MKKINTLEEQMLRMKSLMTEERLYGNLIDNLEVVEVEKPVIKEQTKRIKNIGNKVLKSLRTLTKAEKRAFSKMTNGINDEIDKAYKLFSSDPPKLSKAEYGKIIRQQGAKLKQESHRNNVRDLLKLQIKSGAIDIKTDAAGIEQLVDFYINSQRVALIGLMEQKSIDDLVKKYAGKLSRADIETAVSISLHNKPKLRQSLNFDISDSKNVFKDDQFISDPSKMVDIKVIDGWEKELNDLRVKNKGVDDPKIKNQIDELNSKIMDAKRKNKTVYAAALEAIGGIKQSKSKQWKKVGDDIELEWSKLDDVSKTVEEPIEDGIKGGIKGGGGKGPTLPDIEDQIKKGILNASWYYRIARGVGWFANNLWWRLTFLPKSWTSIRFGRNIPTSKLKLGRMPWSKADATTLKGFGLDNVPALMGAFYAFRMGYATIDCSETNINREAIDSGDWTLGCKFTVPDGLNYNELGETIAFKESGFLGWGKNMVTEWLKNTPLMWAGNTTVIKPLKRGFKTEADIWLKNVMLLVQNMTMCCKAQAKRPEDVSEGANDLTEAAANIDFNIRRWKEKDQCGSDIQPQGCQFPNGRPTCVEFENYVFGDATFLDTIWGEGNKKGDFAPQNSWLEKTIRWGVKKMTFGTIDIDVTGRGEAEDSDNLKTHFKKQLKTYWTSNRGEFCKSMAKADPSSITDAVKPVVENITQSYIEQFKEASLKVQVGWVVGPGAYVIHTETITPLINQGKLDCADWKRSDFMTNGKYNKNISDKEQPNKAILQMWEDYDEGSDGFAKAFCKTQYFAKKDIMDEDVCITSAKAACEGKSYEELVNIFAAKRDISADKAKFNK